jgi:hypothetical protein
MPVSLRIPAEKEQKIKKAAAKLRSGILFISEILAKCGDWHIL